MRKGFFSKKKFILLCNDVTYTWWKSYVLGRWAYVILKKQVRVSETGRVPNCKQEAHSYWLFNGVLCILSTNPKFYWRGLVFSTINTVVILEKLYRWGWESFKIQIKDTKSNTWACSLTGDPLHKAPSRPKSLCARCH